MGAYDNCIILIPALQPDERLTQMIHGLHERGFHKIAVMYKCQLKNVQF